MSISALNWVSAMSIVSSLLQVVWRSESSLVTNKANWSLSKGFLFSCVGSSTLEGSTVVRGCVVSCGAGIATEIFELGLNSHVGGVVWLLNIYCAKRRAAEMGRCARCGDGSAASSQSSVPLPKQRGIKLVSVQNWY
jgi:hypothetical protein